MANLWFGLWKSDGTITLPTSSACSGSAENLKDARVRLCFKVKKPSRMERLRRSGLSFLVRARVTCPGCVVRAVLKVTLEKDPTQLWIIGSNELVTMPLISVTVRL